MRANFNTPRTLIRPTVSSIDCWSATSGNTQRKLNNNIIDNIIYNMTNRVFATLELNFRTKIDPSAIK